MTESPAGDSVPVLQSFPCHVDVSYPMTKSPPYDSLRILLVTTDDECDDVA